MSQEFTGARRPGQLQPEELASRFDRELIWYLLRDSTPAAPRAPRPSP